MMPVTYLIHGDTREAALFHSAIAREVLFTGNPVSRPACMLSGGETTVEVKGNGKGGRNMEFALHGALEIAGYEIFLVAGTGTDGIDGPTDSAGALSDGDTLKRAINMNLDIKNYISDNNSYNFFKMPGDLIITGPTQTNVMDIRVLIII